MKKLIDIKYVFYILIVILLVSCNNKTKYIKSEPIYTNVYITHVGYYKYSKVQGYIYYNNIKLEIDNGNSGYYYKKYSLKNGDVIKCNVTVYQRYYRTTDPYKDDVILSTSDIDVSQYELKN